MKKLFAVLFCLMLPIAMMAQERTGAINGIVVDKDGVPLPGVTLTLTGPTVRPMTATSNAEGRFRFLALHPGDAFSVKAELQGFKTRTETGIIIEIAKNADITIRMEQGTLEEQVTVVAQTPMVQVKKTQQVTTVDYEQLQTMPSARDPWVFLQMTPHIFIDRENVGGNESGSQSSYVNQMSTTQVWSMDGVNVTDFSSNGSPGYYDFDAIEEMNITTGAFDVEVRAPSTIVNLVTRRGGNKMSLAGRFYLTDKYFQGKVSDAKIAELGVAGYNHIDWVKEYGFNFGGPIFKDKAWFWGSYSAQRIQNIMANGVANTFELQNMDIKINLQIIPQNRFEAYFQGADKVGFGRSSSLAFPPGWTQRSAMHFGSPTFKVQDEHMFGDSLFVSFRYGWEDSGFGMWPANDEGMKLVTWYDSERGLYTQGPGGGQGGQTWWFSSRPHTSIIGQIQYFNDNILGTSHEIKLGVDVENNNAHSVGYFYSSKVVPTYNYSTTQLDWNLDGKNDVMRDLLKTLYPTNTPTYARFSVSRSPWDTTTGTDRYAAYFNDTISVGRIHLQLGLRIDEQRTWANQYTAEGLLESDRDWGTAAHMDSFSTMWVSQNKIIDINTAKLINQILIPKTRPDQAQKQFWLVFSPTASFNYDVFGDGKTIAKIAYRLYPGTGLGYGVWSPTGTGGWMNFDWVDLNNDYKIQTNELYWRYKGSVATPYRIWNDDGTMTSTATSRIATDLGTNWGGWVWDNPLGLTAPLATYDLANYKVSLTHDIVVSLERQLSQDMSVSLTYSYRRMGRYLTGALSYYPADQFPTLSDPGHIRSGADYEAVGTIPQVLTDPKTGTTYDPKEAKGRVWYAGKFVDYVTTSTNYTYYRMADPTMCDKYWGWDLVFNKRLSNKWMVTANFTWQTQRTYYGDNYYGNPSTKWAYDGQMWGSSIGYNSNRVGNTVFFSRWMFKVSGLYQLPWDVNVSAGLSAHAGGWNAETFGIVDYTTPNQTNGYSVTEPTTGFDNRNVLGNVWAANLQLEKSLKIGDTGRLYLTADCFNFLNLIPVLRKYDNSYGTFYFNKDGTTTYATPSSLATNNKNSEIMNPFCFRFGARFQI